MNKMSEIRDKLSFTVSILCSQSSAPMTRLCPPRRAHSRLAKAEGCDESRLSPLIQLPDTGCLLFGPAVPISTLHRTDCGTLGTLKKWGSEVGSVRKEPEESTAVLKPGLRCRFKGRRSKGVGWGVEGCSEV